MISVRSRPIKAVRRNNPVAPHDTPSTPHGAFTAGWLASRRGEDLSDVVEDALRNWPVSELPELIASASLGFWAEGVAL
jgi:hypothetical protein